MIPAGSNLCVALSRSLRHGCCASWPATFPPSMRSSGTAAGSGGFRPRAGPLQPWTPWRESGLCRIRPGQPRGPRHSTRKELTTHPQHRKLFDRDITLIAVLGSLAYVASHGCAACKRSCRMIAIAAARYEKPRPSKPVFSQNSFESLHVTPFSSVALCLCAPRAGS